MKCPCQECKIRSPTCHGKCEEYAAFAAERERLREVRQEYMRSADAQYDRAEALRRKRLKATIK